MESSLRKGKESKIYKESRDVKCRNKKVNKQETENKRTEVAVTFKGNEA